MVFTLHNCFHMETNHLDFYYLASTVCHYETTQFLVVRHEQ